MQYLSLNTSYVDFYLKNKYTENNPQLIEAHESIQDKACRGADYLGWIE